MASPRGSIPSTRNRVIYNALNLYVGQTDAISGDHTSLGSVRQLTRVQSFDEDFSRNLVDVNRYGQLAAVDRIDSQSPIVKANFSYLLTDASNEYYMGLTVGNLFSGIYPASCISDILNGSTDSKNYFLTVADDGNDAIKYKGMNTGVIGIGNACITNYSVEAAVGQLPKAAVSLEGFNINVLYPMQGNGYDQLPSVDPNGGSSVAGGFIIPVGSGSNSVDQVAALQPGQMTLSLSGILGFSSTDLKIQNFKLNIPLNRKPIIRVGNKFPSYRPIEFPVKATISIDAELGSLYAGGAPYNATPYSGQLNVTGVPPWYLNPNEGNTSVNNFDNILCDTGIYNLQVAFKNPNCAATGSNALLYQFNNCRLLNQKVSTAIGSNAKLSAEWEMRVGAPEDLTNGVFIYGNVINTRPYTITALLVGGGGGGDDIAFNEQSFINYHFNTKVANGGDGGQVVIGSLSLQPNSTYGIYVGPGGAGAGKQQIFANNTSSTTTSTASSTSTSSNASTTHAIRFATDGQSSYINYNAQTVLLANGGQNGCYNNYTRSYAGGGGNFSSNLSMGVNGAPGYFSSILGTGTYYGGGGAGYLITGNITGVAGSGVLGRGGNGGHNNGNGSFYGQPQHGSDGAVILSIPASRFSSQYAFGYEALFARISGTVLNVALAPNQYVDLPVGSQITGPGVSSGTYITAFLGNANYSINISQNIGYVSMNATLGSVSRNGSNVILTYLSAGTYTA